jgi:very-short-patch-repair endonuclease
MNFFSGDITIGLDEVRSFGGGLWLTYCCIGSVVAEVAMTKTTTLTKARRLRACMTDAEKLLWLQLRDRRFAGYKFRRQLPVGPYFVDFICWRAKLIVELDGGQHADQIAYDQLRTHFLEQQGFTVIRFWNDEVLRNWEGVRQVILWNLQRKISPYSGR